MVVPLHVCLALEDAPFVPRPLVALPSPRILRTFQNLRTPLMVFAPRHLSEARKPLFVKSRRLWFYRGLLGLGAYPRTDPHAPRGHVGYAYARGFPRPNKPR